MTAPIGLPDQLGALLPQRTAGRVDLPVRPEGAADANETSFADHVKELVEGVDQTQKAAETMAQGFANGEHNDLHGSMIAMQQADVTLRLAANVRNRLLEAYREIMRMGA